MHKLFFLVCFLCITSHANAMKKSHSFHTFYNTPFMVNTKDKPVYPSCCNLSYFFAPRKTTLDTTEMQDLVPHTAYATVAYLHSPFQGDVQIITGIYILSNQNDKVEQQAFKAYLSTKNNILRIPMHLPQKQLEAMESSMETIIYIHNESLVSVRALMHNEPLDINKML